jgi:hypothetical protein
MDLVAADPWGGSQVLEDVVVADPTLDGGGARTRCTVGPADMKVGKYGDLLSDDTFGLVAIELTSALTWRSTGFLAVGLEGTPSFEHEV